MGSDFKCILSLCQYALAFWLADSTQFTFKIKKLKVKTAEEFDFSVRNSTIIKILHVLFNNNIIIHQKQLKFL